MQTNNDSTPPAGQNLPNQFEVLQKLGQGGMGVVYKVRNRFTYQIVAIKMLISGKYSDEALQRFQREARATSAFSHANAVVLFDFGLCADGSPYFVMEYVTGPTMQALIDANGKIAQEQVVPIFSQICDCLVKAHQSGVVHRDLKPGNIVLTGQPPDFQVKILDFGIAKIVDIHDVESSESMPQSFGKYGGGMQLTNTGTLLGTPLYMSPEQCTGDPVDARSDIYSLGAVVYHALAGMPPHLGANTFDTMQKKLSEDILSLNQVAGKPVVSKKLEQVVLKCLQRDPAARYQSAQELREQLQTLSLARGKFRHGQLVGMSALAALILLAIAAAYFVGNRTATPDTRQSSSSNGQAVVGLSGDASLLPGTIKSDDSVGTTDTAGSAKEENEEAVAPADKKIHSAMHHGRYAAARDLIEKQLKQADLIGSSRTIELAISLVQCNLNTGSSPANCLADLDNISKRYSRDFISRPDLRMKLNHEYVVVYLARKDEGDLVKAGQKLALLIADGPRDASSWDLMGRWDEANGRVGDALKDCEKAVQFYGKRTSAGKPFAYWHLGQLYAKNGQPEKARQKLEMAKDLNDSASPPGNVEKIQSDLDLLK